MQPCPSIKDCKLKHCPYYHNQEERRKPIQKWFRIFPKCRTVIFPTSYYSKSLLLQKTFNKSWVNLKQTSFSSMAQELKVFCTCDELESTTQGRVETEVVEITKHGFDTILQKRSSSAVDTESHHHHFGHLSQRSAQPWTNFGQQECQCSCSCGDCSCNDRSD